MNSTKEIKEPLHAGAWVKFPVSMIPSDAVPYRPDIIEAWLVAHEVFNILNFSKRAPSMMMLAKQCNRSFERTKQIVDICQKLKLFTAHKVPTVFEKNGIKQHGERWTFKIKDDAQLNKLRDSKFRWVAVPKEFALSQSVLIPTLYAYLSYKQHFKNVDLKFTELANIFNCDRRTIARAIRRVATPDGHTAATQWYSSTWRVEKVHPVKLSEEAKEKQSGNERALNILAGKCKGCRGTGEMLNSDLKPVKCSVCNGISKRLQTA